MFKKSRVYQLVWTYLFLGHNAVLPVVYAASSVSETNNHQEKSSGNTYKVKAGDSLSSIAKRYGISVHTLLAMNESKLATHPLAIGQKIVVPVSEALPDLSGGNPLKLVVNNSEKKSIGDYASEHAARIATKFTSSDTESLNETLADKVSRQTYGSADNQNVTLGTSGTSYGAKEEAQYWKHQAVSSFEAEANQYAQELLGKGTVKTKIALGDDMNIAESSLELLMPFAENKTHMPFIQGGIRKSSNDNVTANIGIGQRHFTKDWMVGYNAFYDQDFTESASRAGIGAEAWRDNLKLSANGYIPVSSWTESDNVEDHLSRAATGIDVNMQAYLPSHPALSGSVTAEKYFGDNVDILGTSQLEKDPHAITLGVGYQPVPLVKFDAKHTETSGGERNTQMGINLEWRIGESLSNMLDSTKVNKSLQGMRYDMVERNNQIVLEYTKAQLMSVELPQSLSGLENNPFDISLQAMRSKHPIAEIVWQSPLFDKLGIPVTQLRGANLSTLRLAALPAFDINGTNIYGITVTIRDIKGNEVSAYSSLEILQSRIKPEIINPDGDRDGDGLTNAKESELGTDPDKEDTDGDGIDDKTELDNGTDPLDPTHPLDGGMKLLENSLKVSRNNAVPNGSDSNELEVSVVDAAGKPKSGVLINWSVSEGKLFAESSVTDSSGVARMTVTHTSVAKVTVKASLLDNNQQADVNFAAGLIATDGVRVTDLDGADVPANPAVGTTLHAQVRLEGESVGQIGRGAEQLNDGTSLTYQWQRSNDGITWSNVASVASQDTYTTDGADQGYTFRVNVTAQ